MQALRSFRRTCRGPGLNRVTDPRRCGASLPGAIRLQRVQQRKQHDNFGPHKEYFQTPGKEPKPDLTPYIREPQRPSAAPSQTRSQSASTQKITPGQATYTEDAQPNSGRWLRIPRVIRSAIWFALFLSLGWAAGTALITWEYLSPPFEPGSPEEQELIEEILETLDTHTLVQELRESEWVEVEAFTPDLQMGLKGRNMVHQVLGGNNTQGVFMKVFHHPVHEFTMLVVFVGFGVEGWPDVVHGGMVSTLLQEGLTKHVAYYHPDHYATAKTKSSIDFMNPCKPGDIYGILIAPSGYHTATSGNVHVTELHMTGVLVQLAALPALSSSFDASTNVQLNSVEVTPATRRQSAANALLKASIKVVPKQLDHTGNTFQVGSNDNEGFANAISILKTWPEFQGKEPKPEAGEKKEED